MAKQQSGFFANVFEGFLVNLYFLRHKILLSAIVGLIVGVGIIYIFPQSYTIYSSIRRSSLVGVNSPLLVIYEGAGEVSFKERQDQMADFVDNSIEYALNDLEIFKQAYSRVFGEVNLSEQNQLFTDTVNVTRRESDPRIQNAEPVRFDVAVSSPDSGKIREFVAAYQAELAAAVRKSIILDVQEIIRARSLLKDIRFRSDRELFVARSNARLEELSNAIALAQVAGIEKPVLPSEISLSSQIPLEAAVPRYFFGWDVLDAERVNVEKGISKEVVVPGYPEYVADRLRLAELMNSLDTVQMKLLEIKTSPEIAKKINGMKKIAILLISVFVVFAGYVTYLFWAAFQKEMERREG